MITLLKRKAENKMQGLENLYCCPDGWIEANEKLVKDDGYSDSSFKGCEYRLHGHYPLAVNIELTGRMSHFMRHGSGVFKTRVKIEFVGDGEPSEFTGGWIYSDTPLRGVN